MRGFASITAFLRRIFLVSLVSLISFFIPIYLVVSPLLQELQSIYLYFHIHLVSVVSVVAGFRLDNSIFGTYFSGFTGFTEFPLYSYVFTSCTMVARVAGNNNNSIL